MTYIIYNHNTGQKFAECEAKNSKEVVKKYDLAAKKHIDKSIMPKDDYIKMLKNFIR